MSNQKAGSAVKLTPCHVPDFFVVGAPKCGTTALCRYLQNSSDVFIPDRKELHFFGQDLDYHYRVETWNEYNNIYQQATQNQIKGDGSVWYLFSRSAASEIYEANPDAKIIIMLRRPVDILYSLHSTYLLNGYENIRSFEKVIQLDEAGRDHNYASRSRISKYGLIYRGAVRFRQQIPRYLETFGPERVKFILYEDFCNSTANEVKKTFQFLGVNSVHMEVFPAVNVSRRWNNLRLHWFLENPPSFIQAISGVLADPKNPRAAGRYLLRKADHRFNLDRSKRAPLKRQFRKKLAEEFREDIGYVESLLQRNLSNWYE